MQCELQLFLCCWGMTVDVRTFGKKSPKRGDDCACAVGLACSFKLASRHEYECWDGGSCKAHPPFLRAVLSALVWRRSPARIQGPPVSRQRRSTAAIDALSQMHQQVQCMHACTFCSKCCLRVYNIYVDLF